MLFDTATFTPGAAKKPADSYDKPRSSLEMLQDKTILVIDDEWLIAEQHADILTSVGARVVGPFTRLDDAMAADLSAVDGALLDFALDEGTSLPLARKLKDEGKPIAFVTGYGSAMKLPAPFENSPVIAKPANATSILAGAARLIARKAT